MIRLTVRLDDSTYQALRLQARQRQISTSALIREALQAHVGKQQISFISTGASGYSDTSVKHDEVFAESIL